jgi:hypothetical protein
MSTFVVVGSAQCVWADLAKIPPLLETGCVIPVNDMMLKYIGPRIAGATLHAEAAHKWRGHGGPIYSHVDDGVAVTDLVPMTHGWHGTSALYACEVAFHLGATKVVLAGCPIDGAPNCYPGRPSLEGFLQHYRRGWENALPSIKGRVFSLSGWTADLLGQPSLETL